jgi:xanthine dehydrogenase accessory factor
MEQADRAPGVLVVVRGVGDIGSAVAHRLFREGYPVAIHDDPRPTATRRGMAFTDAVFDGRAVLDGVEAVRIDELGDVAAALGRRETIPLYIGPWARFLSTLEPRVLIDARMRKHSAPEGQRGSADVTIGLGPSLVAGRHADLVIETSWDDLGRVIRDGASRPLAGEPREIQGHARDRYVYAPVEGVFRTNARIGDAVRQGEAIATIDGAVVTAPLDGVLRGLTRDGVPVSVRTKVIEVDPRSRHAEVRGIAERPRRIAEAVLSVITATIGRGPRDVREEDD